MTQARIQEGTTSPTGVWVDLLRANCLTLQSSDAVKALSVSRAFTHGDEPARDAVIVLAQRMAEEYGLVAETELHGYYLTVRYARAAEERATRVPSSEPSLLERVWSILNLRRKGRAETETASEPTLISSEVRS